MKFSVHMFEFKSIIRGYHVYQKVWEPELNEVPGNTVCGCAVFFRKCGWCALIGACAVNGSNTVYRLVYFVTKGCFTLDINFTL